MTTIETEPTEMLPADAAVPTKRADLPVIWEDFKTQLEKLKATAETVNVTDAKDKAGMSLARTTRITLKNLRVAIEKKRKELGEDALRQKQRIDNGAKELTALIEPLETRLLEQEEFAERAEAKRKEDLANERVALLRPLGTDCSLYNLREMADEAFTELHAGLKAANEAKIAAAKKAEEDRLAKEKADAEERERVRLENERLKAEAAEKERALQAERERVAKEQAEAAAKAAAERKALEEKARAEREKAEAELRAAAEKAEAEKRAAAEVARKEREAIEAKAKAEGEAAEKKAAEERAAREKVEAELRAKAAAEEAARKAAALAAKKAAAAPDKEKLLAFAATVAALIVPECKTEDGKKVAELITSKVAGFAKYITEQTASL